VPTDWQNNTKHEILKKELPQSQNTVIPVQGPLGALFSWVCRLTSGSGRAHSMNFELMRKPIPSKE
jgi:hypothetical protein